MQKNQSNENNSKEKRIKELSFIYYSRPDIRKSMLKFSENREVIPRYYESFGKRPDNFQYENDILEYVRKGATSFHCSEELWSDPLEISNEYSRDEFNNLRIGWDLLLDIDSPYLEYSKVYTELLIEALKFHSIENIGVKFSGSKGFHLIIPWKAFPKELYNEKTKNMFPEWPRIICSYLSDFIKPKLSDKIFKDESLKDLSKKTGRSEDELLVDECISCHRPSAKKDKITWLCNNCRDIGEITRIEKNKRIPKCPECRKPLSKKSKEEILYCIYCNFSSDKNPEMFKRSAEKTEILINADLILVAPRHLFRMPYSLHEKTALSSIVIDKDKIKDFQITDAKPLKVELKEFYPQSKENEAKNLLLQALEWNEQKIKKELIIQEKKESISKNQQFKDFKKSSNKEFKQIKILNPSSDIFPPQINLLLKGVKQDGRKRALFILLSFFRSLGVDDIEIEKRIFEWNEKNYLPLKKGYIQSQLSWYKKNPSRLPPNFNNYIYKDLGVDKPDSLSLQTKNPVNYAVKKYFASRR